MAKPPADPDPSHKPVAWTADDTFRLLTTERWEAEEMASLFQMWQKAGQATFFEAVAMLLKERAATDALVAAFKGHYVALTDNRETLVKRIAILERLNAILEKLAAVLEAHPAALLAAKHKGTTYENKLWRKLVLANDKLMRNVLDPDVKPAWLSREIEKWLEEKHGLMPPQRPQTQAIGRWIRDQRKRAAAQAQ
jgi:hypothetical protein